MLVHDAVKVCAIIYQLMCYSYHLSNEVTDYLRDKAGVCQVRDVVVVRLDQHNDATDCS